LDCRDKNTIQTLYAQTGRAALLKTARLVGRLDVAEEIVQTAFLKLWDAGLSFPDQRAAYAWIYRTCHNAGIDHIRAHATRFESGVASEQLDSFAAGVPGVLDKRLLVERLQQLNEREAQVLAYRLMDGMTQTEIAEVMGLSRKTIVRVCAELDRKLLDDAPLAEVP
jgi:RNA polymerase sigma-70 factor, ECF subfamily